MFQEPYVFFAGRQKRTVDRQARQCAGAGPERQRAHVSHAPFLWHDRRGAGGGSVQGRAHRQCFSPRCRPDAQLPGGPDFNQTIRFNKPVLHE